MSKHILYSLLAAALFTQTGCMAHLAGDHDHGHYSSSRSNLRDSEHHHHSGCKHKNHRGKGHAHHGD